MSRTDNRSGFRDNGYAGFEHIQDSSYGDRPLSVIAAEASANNWTHSFLFIVMQPVDQLLSIIFI